VIPAAILVAVILLMILSVAFSTRWKSRG